MKTPKKVGFFQSNKNNPFWHVRTAFPPKLSRVVVAVAFPRFIKYATSDIDYLYGGCSNLSYGTHVSWLTWYKLRLQSCWWEFRGILRGWLLKKECLCRCGLQTSMCYPPASDCMQLKVGDAWVSHAAADPWWCAARQAVLLLLLP